MRRDENYREMTKDRAGRTIYAFKVGDRVRRRSTGETGIIVNRYSLADTLAWLSDVEARNLVDRVNSEYLKTKDFYRYQVATKDLILTLEPSDMEPDTSHNERTVDVIGQVEDDRKGSPG